MEDILNGPGPYGIPRPPLPCLIYLDDFTITSKSLQDCLSNMAEAIKKILEAGAMVNLRKSTIGGLTGKILG